MKKITFPFVFAIIAQISIAQVITLDIKVYLEGPFNGVEMNTTMNGGGLLPLAHPFNQPPWNYSGTESVAAIPNGDIIDWILLELRETTGDPSTAGSNSMVARQAVFLLKNGQLVDLNGTDFPQLTLTVTDNLYVVLWHRNHLGIMSSTPLPGTAGTYSYDFTDNVSKAYLNGQKEMSPGISGMIAGDCDGNGIIDETDKNDHWYMVAGEAGYDPADINLDGQINNLDKDDFWIMNAGSASTVPTMIPFICGEQITDYDGHVYNTIQIGTQCWMKENLKTTSYRNGNPIQNITNATTWSTLTSGAYVWYNNDIGWKDHYGALYNWYAAMDPNGLCPEGWHIPSDNEWTILTNTIGGAGSPHGNELKSCRQVNSPISGGCNTTEHPRWDADDIHYGTDTYGFSGLPGGTRRFYNGGFFNMGAYGGWWSSTPLTSDEVLMRGLGNYYGFVDYNYYNKKDGYSVRCLKD
ncbi:MAG: fibrobacter succinogenes major paralogous domain-containing protein [Bacteroidetes bacterium]|nr:fibrobacter succinogenes major paralogous domain-containing protein [Bacteroidota bacterium]